MSFENERRRRINTIMELIEKSGRSGVVPQLLYQKVAPEITKERLFMSEIARETHLRQGYTAGSCGERLARSSDSRYLS